MEKNMKNIKKISMVLGVALLASTPLFAGNNLICPALKYSDIKKVTNSSSEFTFKYSDNYQVRFRLEGAAALPNWTNPLTKTRWAPEVEGEEFTGTAMLKCNYKYKTLIGKTYKFSIQAVLKDDLLMAIAGFGLSPDAQFKAIKKAYRTVSLVVHPDKGGSVEAMQTLNSQYDVIKAHFGD